MQGVSLDRSAGSLNCIDILEHLDIWDPDRTLQQLKAFLQNLKHADGNSHLVVIDSLSYISSALGESCRRTVLFTQALTRLV